MSLNNLLIWMSARGRGSWTQFRSAVEQLYVEPPEGDADEENVGDTRANDLPLYQLVRLNLERLGHVEFESSAAGPNWRVVPPSLAVASRGGRFEGVLCGARFPGLHERISQLKGLQSEIREKAGMPDCIRLLAPDLQTLLNAAQALGAVAQIEAPAALLAAIPPVDDPRSRFPSEPPRGPGWTVERFAPHDLGWTVRHPREDRNLESRDLTQLETGLFRFRMKYQRFYFLQWKGRSYKVPVQVGKYAVLRSQRVRRLLRYHKAGCVFSVPVSCRPPLLIERALILCSGLLPSLTNDGHLEYSEVPLQIAQFAASLLRQEVQIQ